MWSQWSRRGQWCDPSTPEAMTAFHGAAPAALEPSPIPAPDQSAIGMTTGTSTTNIAPAGDCVTTSGLSTWAVARHMLVAVLVLGGSNLL
jgi:hypothetical protein